MSDYFSQDLCPSSSSWVPWSALGLLSEFAKAGPGANPVLQECPLHGPPLHPPTSFSFPWEEGLPWLTRVGALCPQVWRSDVQFAWKRLLCPDGEFLGGDGE